MTAQHQHNPLSERMVDAFIALMNSTAVDHRSNWDDSIVMRHLRARFPESTFADADETVRLLFRRGADTMNRDPECPRVRITAKSGAEQALTSL